MRLPPWLLAGLFTAVGLGALRSSRRTHATRLLAWWVALVAVALAGAVLGYWVVVVRNEVSAPPLVLAGALASALVLAIVVRRPTQETEASRAHHRAVPRG